MTKLKTMSCVLVCVAIGGITSMASAVVEFGVVGGGIHAQFGPQDDNGDYLGIVSESYDWYMDWGFSYIFPGDNTYGSPAGHDGYVLLALNPYTGEIWTDIPVEHQAYNPASSYSGHGPLTMISGPSGLPDDPETPDVDESLVYSDYVSNLTPSSSGLTDDCIFITGEHRNSAAGGIFGAFVSTSPDGGLLSSPSWDPLGNGTRDKQNLADGTEVRAYAVGDPDSPDPGLDLSFGTGGTTVWGYVGMHNWMWYTGTLGSGTAYCGFEMDGIKGWIKMNFSGHRSGVRLMEYYFDVPVLGDFSGPEGVADGQVDAYDIDELCDNMGGDPGTYDLNNDSIVDEGDLVYLVTVILGTYMGDFNLDGVVNATDLGTMSTNFGLTGFGWAGGNANCDDVINATDLGTLSTNFGLGGGGSSVPEPATLGLLAMGACLALVRRKRR